MLRSLHLRLIVWLMLLLGSAWIGIWVNSRATVERTAATDIDSRLRIIGAQLLQVAAESARSTQRDPPESMPAAGLDAGQASSNGLEGAWSRAPSFEIVDDNNRVLARSEGFPRDVRSSAPGFETHVVDNMKWRVFTVTDRKRGFTCRVAVEQSGLEARTAELNRDFTQPLLWILPVLAFAALASVWRGLVPLRKIEKAIADQDPRSPQPLGIDARRVPTELSGLIGALDRLFERLGDVLARQRAFTAAAGHEMRTPLAGCKTQVQVAQRSRDASVRNSALTQVQQSIDRLTHLVSQLLLLARVDPTAPALKRDRLDITQLVRSVVAGRQDMAARKGVNPRFHHNAEPARLLGDAALIESMIANLLDNAIRFSPPGAAVDISVGLCDGDVVVTVRDYGRGMSEQEREHVFDHFYRQDSGAGPGSGLGLTIVQTVAKAHRGKAELQPAEGAGTRAIVRLPALNANKPT